MLEVARELQALKISDGGQFTAISQTQGDLPKTVVFYPQKSVRMRV